MASPPETNKPIPVKEVKEGKEGKEGKKKRPRGFAADIFNQLKALNGNEYFKEKYGTDQYDILLIATDDSHAALVHIDKGSVEIDDILNKPEDIKAIKPKPAAVVKTNYERFIKLAMGKLDPIPDVLKFKIRVSGVKKVLRFVKYFKVISYIMKQQRKNANPEGKLVQTADKSPEPDQK